MIDFFFSSRRRHTRYWRDWSSDVCSSDLQRQIEGAKTKLTIHPPNYHPSPIPANHSSSQLPTHQLNPPHPPTKTPITMKTHNPTNGDRLRLTPHFTLEEMTRSATACRYHVDNTPSPEAVHNLRRLCTKVLEPLRKEFGPIRVTSGYRSEWLNRMVGEIGRAHV